MGFVTLMLLAFGLSMDASAVSISNTMCYKELGRREMVRNSLCFGVFQGLMPIIGYFAGRLFEAFITTVDHWMALVLLGFIGGKMVVEGVRTLRGGSECNAEGAYTRKTMLVQAVATSIDALAVGISLAALSVNIWLSALLIAAITFVCSCLGSLLGRRFGTLLGDWAQIIGGLILVGIGVKIFVEHMFG